MNDGSLQHKSFAERLRFLLSVVRHPSGREYNVTEVAEAINASGRYSISRSYITLLRDGTKPMPSRDCCEALADFFGVPASYFYDDETARFVEREIALVSAFRHSPVRRISLHAFGLSAESIEVLANTISRLRQLEGLPSTIDGPTKRRRRMRGHEPGTVGAPQEATPSDG